MYLSAPSTPYQQYERMVILMVVVRIIVGIRRKKSNYQNSKLASLIWERVMESTRKSLIIEYG